MEGDPPWLVSAYKPDPRLPPDQQLLPTVARRLQQEKWEQEGKFGSIYDKDFRPLTGEGFLSPPENMPSSSSDDIVKQEVEKPADDWPLKSPEVPKSPASPPCPRSRTSRLPAHYRARSNHSALSLRNQCRSRGYRISRRKSRSREARRRRAVVAAVS